MIFGLERFAAKNIEIPAAPLVYLEVIRIQAARRNGKRNRKLAPEVFHTVIYGRFVFLGKHEIHAFDIVGLGNSYRNRKRLVYFRGADWRLEFLKIGLVNKFSHFLLFGLYVCGFFVNNKGKAGLPLPFPRLLFYSSTLVRFQIFAAYSSIALSAAKTPDLAILTSAILFQRVLSLYASFMSLYARI